ncbi:hypothetical protein ACNKU7_06140 [Microbulbifer sp. SA54]|uniref:hypothetical protein n=1 Tax=Microbulbifer sp. SA54 TaxID=3401577 RepID=UPI003AAA5523
MPYLKILLPILTFTSLLIAIRGKTWNKELDRITRLGWAALLIGLATASISVILTYNQIVENEKIVEKEIEDKKIANEATINLIKRISHLFLGQDSFNTIIGQDSCGETLLAIYNLESFAKNWSGSLDTIDHITIEEINEIESEIDTFLSTHTAHITPLVYSEIYSIRFKTALPALKKKTKSKVPHQINLYGNATSSINVESYSGTSFLTVEDFFRFNFETNKIWIRNFVKNSKEIINQTSCKLLITEYSGQSKVLTHILP